MGHHLFRDQFGAATPYAIGVRIPKNFYCLIQIDLSELRFIDKCANSYMMHVRHFSQQIAFFDEITLMNGQRVQRSVGAGNTMS